MDRPSEPSIGRRLLAKIRDVAAGPGDAEERLTDIVAHIAEDMIADVCSVYIRRPGDVMELFATKGLKAAAVHFTRLRVGEGLVGEIAAHPNPLATSDAQNHPNFVYRPETGEEVFHSFLGVPILRAGRSVGVLVVQSQDRHEYGEEEIETLQTVAMVIAEMVAGGELVRREELLLADGNAMVPLRLDGVRLNAGLAHGIAILHQTKTVIHRLVAEEPADEFDRLDEALAALKRRLDSLIQASDIGREYREILEVYRFIAGDRGWITRIQEAIGQGLTAEAAVMKVHNDTRARFSEVKDPYLKDRQYDFEDVANRLLEHLTGETPHQVTPEEDYILIARNMGPAELLAYDRKYLRGLVLEEGSQTSHVAIVARALDIPVVGHVHDVLTKVESHDPIVLDADHAQVFVRPGDDILTAVHQNIKLRARKLAEYRALRDQPAVTRDGVQINLLMNAGLLSDVQHMHEVGADGIGLYRTEMDFMARDRFLNAAEQAELYETILDHAKEKAVTFRTLDVGGDKILPYWDETDEENPAMGWRAVRVMLDRPAMMRQQFRALISAAKGREVRILIPMVSEVAEFLKIKRLLDLELKRFRDRTGKEPSVKLGVMVEVPSLIFQFPVLLKHADFVSVGSNDLFQFLFASDRQNPRLSDRYDALSPPVFQLLKGLVMQCDDAGVPISLCGEMAGSTLDALALIGLGFRNISMAPSSIGPVKAMVRSTDLKALGRYLSTLIDLPHHSVREKLRGFALDHGINL